MEVTNTSSELGMLIQLQEWDQKIHDIEQRMLLIPAELETLAQVMEANRADEKAAADQLEEVTRSRKRLEVEIEDLRLKLSKYKTQLMTVKTNKEYQAVLHEIVMAEEKIAAREDDVLELMLKADDLTHEVRERREAFEQKEVELQARRGELQRFNAAGQSEIDQLKDARKQLEGRIPPDLLAHYDRIFAYRNGVAVVEVRNQSCQGCHVRLRPQFVARLRTNLEIMICESCSRILYYAGPTS